MTPIEFLAGWALRSSILILSGGLLMWALRVKDPSIRQAAWTALLCVSLAIPALTAALPKVHVPIMKGASRPVEAAGEFRPAQGRFVVETFAVTHCAPARQPLDWKRTATIAYALVAFALLLRLCVGLAMSRRLLRGSRETRLGADVRESDGLTSPVALGIVRAAIVLPSDWREWESARLDAVLAHERSHIRRLDPAVQLLSAIHRALLWFSPTSWFLHRRIVQVAEEASDDAALAVHRDRASYAETLLDFMQRGARGGTMQGVAMARYGSAEARIDRILDGTELSRGVTRRSMAAILLLGAPLAFVVAAADKPLAFEAASVKPATLPADVTLINGGGMVMPRGSGIAIPRNTGGPGTDDPDRIHFPLISLKNLLGRAYDSYFEIRSPGWMESEFVQVEATMPKGTTKEQFREMLRNLIAERFGLKYHVEAKEIAGYALVIARDGLKLKEAAPASDASDESDPPPAPRPRKIGPDGFPIPPSHIGPGFLFMGMPGDHARMVGQRQTMQDLADAVGRMLHSKVTDETGLKAKYDVTLTFAGHLGGPGGLVPTELTASPGVASEPPDLSDIFGALQSQLGLRLEKSKVSVEVLVIDRMDKTPSGN